MTDLAEALHRALFYQKTLRPRDIKALVDEIMKQTQRVGELQIQLERALAEVDAQRALVEKLTDE